jgi:Mrp family chromosome partitioning ATPase
MNTTLTNGALPSGPVNGAGEASQAIHATNGKAGTPRSRGVKKRRDGDPFDDLLWRLETQPATASGGARTLGFVGCEKRTGVTTLAANLAVRASELQLGPVLLVEAEGERSKLRKAWRLGPGPGLAELMSGAAAFSDCLYAGPSPSLHVVPASAGQRGDGSAAWDAGAIDALLAEACADHRLVLFDLPNAGQLQQTVRLARRLDQVLLVIRAESTRARDAQRVADRLTEDGVPLSGAVLNRSRSYVPRWLKRWI